MITCFLIELIKLIQKTLQVHRQLLSQVLNFSLDTLAGDMLSHDLISESTKNSSTYDAIMNDIITRMNEQNNAAQLEEFCQLLLTCISKQNGASSQEVAKMLSKQWQEVALKHCGISLSFNTDTNPETATEGIELGLLNAAKYGHNETVQFLITSKVNIDCTNEQSNTALMLATECRHEPVVQTLIFGGANVNAQDNEGQTALMIATKNNSFEIVLSLLIAGADADKADKNGETALTIACRMGHSKIGKLLIEKNAKVFTTTSSGDTPLLLSAKCPVLCKLIFSKLPSNVPRAYLLSAFAEACKHGKSVVIVMLLQKLCGQKEVENLFMSSVKGSSSIKDLVTHTAVDSTLVGGIMPLMIASSCGHTEVVEELLKSGANVNCADDNGSTPLVYALNGSSENSSRVIELLIHAGADLSSAVSKFGETQLENIVCKEQNNCAALKLLLLAKKFECLIDEVKLALEKKLSLNELLMADVVNYIGTLVYLPKECENIDILFSKLQVSFSTLNVGLIQKVVTKFFPSSSEVRIHMEKYVAMLQTYESNTTIEQVGQSMEVIPLPQPNTSTQVIIKFNSAWWKVSIKNMKKFLNRSFSVSSCFFNHVSISEDDSALICKYYLPECQTKTLLATAEQNSTFMGSVGVFKVIVVTGDSEVIVLQEKMNNSFEFQSTFLKSSTTDVNIDVIEFVTQVERCINIEDKNEAGRTVLMLATECGHEPVVQTLISGEANVNAQDNEGWTPLMIASKHNFINIVHILLKADADPYMKRDNGSNALTIGSFYGSYEVVELLITQEKFDCNYQRNDGVTALMFASRNGHLQIAELLLNKGADPNITNTDGFTALMVASYNGHLQIAELLLTQQANLNLLSNDEDTALILASSSGHPQVVELLLKGNVDPNIQNNNGCTALMLASCHGHLQVVELLLKENADPNIQDDDGFNALMCASCQGHSQVVELLLKKNANLIQRLKINFSTSMFRDKSETSNKFPLLEQFMISKVFKEDVEFLIEGNVSALMMAASSGDLTTFKLLLQHVDCNMVGPNGYTALTFAIDVHNYEMVELLLDHGASTDIPGNPMVKFMIANSIAIYNTQQSINIAKLLLEHVSSTGFINIAMLQSMLFENENIIKLLLDKHIIDPNKVIELQIESMDFGLQQVCDLYKSMPDDIQSGNPFLDTVLQSGNTPEINTTTTPLMLAAGIGRLKIVKLLFEYGANPNIQHDVCTALMCASFQGHLQVVELLLKENADPNIQNNNGITALMGASHQGHLQIVELLLKKNADPNIQANNGFTALMCVSHHGHLQVVELLLKENADPNIQNNNGITALMGASHQGHLQIVELLLKKNADPNIQANNGFTALMCVSHHGHLQVVELLLKENADPNIQANNGFTALMCVSHHGHLQVVELLLKENADPNIQANNGFTALMCVSHHGHLQVVELLLKENVDPNIQDNNGCTALMYASHQGHLQVVELLLKENADPNIQDNNGFTALMCASHLQVVELLLKENADPNIQANNGFTALMCVSHHGHLQVVELLLKENADPNIQANNGFTALMCVSHHGHLQVVELLLKENVDPNIQDNNGCTALMYASHQGHLQVVELLLKENADPNIQANNGFTALMCASCQGHSQVVELLLKKNAKKNANLIQRLKINFSTNIKSETTNLLEQFSKVFKEDVEFLIEGNVSALMMAASSGDLTTFKLLLQHVDCNMVGPNGYTALTFAIDVHNYEMVELLLDHGASTDIPDNPMVKFMIANSIAIYNTQQSINIAKLLLEHKSDLINTVMLQSIMFENEDIIKLLLDRCMIDPNKVNNFEIPSMDFNLQLVHDLFKSMPDNIQSIGNPLFDTILQHGKEWLKKDPTLFIIPEFNATVTPLMCAAAIGSLKIMKLLFKYGANPNIQNTEGLTALMCASNVGHLQVVELLLKENADPNIQDNDGYTALMCAASCCGHSQVVELLLKENADPNIQYTALKIAGQNNHLNVVELLFRKGFLIKVMERPHALLQEWLNSLVEWKQFATYLPGITDDMISMIDIDEHKISNKKIELYSIWLRVCPTASWNDVIIALEKAKENKLAEDIKQKLHQYSLDYIHTNAIATQPVSGSCTNEISIFSHFLAFTSCFSSAIIAVADLAGIFENVHTKRRLPEVLEERMPEIHELLKWLNVLVEWKAFGLHLPKITDDIIQKIDKETYLKNIDDKKRALYSKWLSVCPTASWNDVIIALEKAKENTLAEDIKQKVNYGFTAPKPKRV